MTRLAARYHFRPPLWQFYADLQKNGYEVKEELIFSAGNGWFGRFKTRAFLHSINRSGEAASSSNEPAAAAFKPTLKKHIEGFGYSAKQGTWGLHERIYPSDL